MDIHELKIFLNLCESLHFGRTSRACHVSPSALTRLIHRLEEEVGDKLFSRDNRTVALTHAGMHCRDYAQDVVQRWNELQHNLADEKDELKGEISIYCSVTACYSVLPELLAPFRKKYPNVHVKLQTGDAESAQQRVMNGETDVAITAFPLKPPKNLEYIKLTETPLVFIVANNYNDFNVTQSEKVDWEAVPMIFPDHGQARIQLDSWFKNRGIVPNIYAQISGNEGIIAMVSLGCGVGVVPELVLEKSPLKDNISKLTVTPKLKPYKVGVCILKKGRFVPTVQAFWQLVSSVGLPSL